MHGNPTAYAVHLVRDYGPSILEELEGIKKIYKFSRADLLDIKEKYEQLSISAHNESVK